MSSRPPRRHPPHRDPPPRPGYRDWPPEPESGEEEDLPPIWLAPERRGPRRPVVSTGAIADAALAVADADGIEAVSMRRIAGVLGIGTMTLYTYVRNKDDLLDLMYDAVAAESLVEDLPSDWRSALTAIARASRAGLRRHPWMLTEVGRRSLFGSPNMLRHIEQSAAAVAGIDADEATRTLFLTAVDDYTLGFTIREAMFARLNMRVLESEEFSPYLRRMFASGQFSHLEEWFERGFHLPKRENAFEAGLALLLDGMAAHLAQRVGREQPNG